jgi:hypothetical protein
MQQLSEIFSYEGHTDDVVFIFAMRLASNVANTAKFPLIGKVAYLLSDSDF